uniref:RING-type domain-containing protein n=1 Tax=Gossypium raimondii TaxID=29730 RepID=A0A0D2QNF9_GOSRA|nr:hypothetical protein B456_001G105000 [Gossypium raimondii]
MSSSTEIFSSSREKLKAKSSNMRIHKRKLHDHQVQNNSPMKKQKGVVIDDGSSNPLFCRLCGDQNPTSNIFNETHCGHRFCSDCIRRHIVTKLKDENTIAVGCPEPNCDTSITPEQCESILPGEVIYRRDDALLYSVILPLLVFECPYEDCKAKLIDEVMGGTECECPNCLTIICGECRDFKHEGMGCEKFKEFGNLQ